MNVELEKKYLSLITDLKILAGRAKDESEAKRYITLYKQLQKIREQRHLDLIGEDGENKTRYRQMLEFVDNNYSAENGEDNNHSAKNSVDSAKNICELFYKKTKERDDDVR